MIQPELLKCSMCCADYNSTTCVPKILSCGHTVCSQCVDQILIIRPPKCPLDQKQIANKDSSKDFLTNLAIVQLLDERSSVKYGLCLTHQEPKNLFCVTDKAKVCQRCVDEKDDPKHEGHEIKPVSEIQAQAQVKSEQLKAVMRKTDIEQQKIYELIEERKKEAHGLKKRKFDQIRQFIDRKEEEAWSEIEVVFLQKQAKTEERFKKDMQLKEELQIQLNVLRSGDMDDKFFNMLKKEVDGKCTIKDEKQEIDTFTKKIVNRFKAKDDSLQKSLGEAFKKFHPKLDLDEESKTEAGAEQQDQDYYFQLSKISDILGLRRLSKALRVTYPEVWPEGSLEPLDFNEIKEVVLNLRSEKITKEIVSAVCYLWRKVEDVKDLTINLRNHNINKGDEYSLFFSHDFWASDKIETFKFNMRDYDDITRGGLTDTVITTKLFGPMHKMVNLKVLHFSLGATDLTDESVGKFADEVLVKFTKLEELVLDFGWTHISDASIKKICSKVSECIKNLKKFHLDFSGSGAGDETLTSLTRSVFPKLEKLEDFSLDMDHTEIDDKSVEKFFIDSRQYMKNIKSYKLSVNCCGITDKPIKAFAKYVLPLMTNLEHFSLVVLDGSLTDISIEKLFQKFNGPNIKSFEFEIINTNGALTNQSYTVFTQELLPRMPNLESLSLALDGTKITNEGVKTLWNALEPVAKNLKHFKTRLRYTEVSDEGFEMFIDKILPAMESLTRLELHLNDLLSEEYFNKLFTQLKNRATNMEELKLKFDGDQGITAENINLLAKEVLPKMKKLKELRLDLSNTDISVENVESICAVLKDLTNLEYCCVKYYGLESEEDSLEDLKDSNPNLYIDEDLLKYE